MNFRISPTIRVSFGLMMLTLSILFVGDWLGLIPHEQKLQLEHRKKFSESLAVQFSSLARSGEMTHIRTTLEALVERNDEVESAAFRSLAGAGGVVAGNHEELWTLAEDEQISTLDQVIVPIFKGDERWGSVEVRFSDHNTAWYSPLLNNSFVTLMVFVCLSGFVLYMLFLKRVLRELDPTRAVPERVTAAFDSLAEGVLILDEEGRIVLANQAFIDNVATKYASLIGLKAEELNWSNYDSSADISNDRLPWVRVLNAGESITGEKLTIHSGSNLERSFTVNCTPVTDGQGAVRGAIITFDDLTELEKRNEALKETLTSLKQTQSDVNLKNKELQYLATRDPLTSCLNRRSFTEQLTTLYEQANSYNTDLVCIMVDIDHFKRINDNYGHALGDKVIKFVADVLKKQIRRDDLLGRYGGEEFCVVLDGSSIDEAVIVADRMRKEIIAGDPGLFTSALRITASFGLASIYDEPDDQDELVNKADKALYLAKESGRNKVMVWELQPSQQKALVDKGDIDSGEDNTQVSSGLVSLQDPLARIQQLEQIAQEKAEQLDRYATHDQVTQLPERALFVDRVQQALLQAKRGGRVLAVVSLGLEGLNRINDTLGHESAEELLQETTERLKEVLRNSDTIALFSSGELETTISKLNEGEFGMLLPSVLDTESITWIVKRIFDALQEPLYISDHNISVSCNVGIGVFPSDADDATTLIRHASVARYFAEQQSGLNNVEYFSEDINRSSKEQLNLESQMSDAIDNEEFELVYQPKVSLDSGDIIGFEALLRWNHPVRGLLTPNEFIDIAERTRLINLIGDWVLRKSCLQIMQLKKACRRDLSIAVNLSPVQFSQPDLAQRIITTLEEVGIDPTDLELELTESSLMENMEEALETLVKLQSKGIAISIDDFGTGYSGLSYLRTLPINMLKIDRSFIADIGSNEHDTAIVAAVISMAKALGLKVVAEGVETSRQMSVLLGMECDEAQGYLFSRPVSAQAALELVATGQDLISLEQA